MSADVTTNSPTVVITDISHVVDLALEHRLYVPGWCLSYALRDIRQDIKKNQLPTYVRAAVIMKNSIAVSVAIKLPNTGKYVRYGGRDKDDSIMCFTKKRYRRQGFGTLALRSVGGFHPTKTEYGDGAKGSDRFFANYNKTQQ